MWEGTDAKGDEEWRGREEQLLKRSQLDESTAPISLRPYQKEE
jgi:hypothetical protein